jgi:hypothetical protein
VAREAAGGRKVAELQAQLDWFGAYYNTVAGLDARILTQDGELIRALTLNPSRDYQPVGRVGT